LHCVSLTQADSAFTDVKSWQTQPYRPNLTACSSSFSQVAFQLDSDPDNAQMVAWTTTPWTLPSNLSLCVNPEMAYVRVCVPASLALLQCLLEAAAQEGWAWCRTAGSSPHGRA